MLPPSRRCIGPGPQVGELSSAGRRRRPACAAGTALIVGGADHVLSAFAAGVNEPGDALVKLGGAGDILVASDTRVVDERLYLDAHPVPGHWLPNGCMATSGSLIRWFQALIGGDDLTVLDDEARRPRRPRCCACPTSSARRARIHDPDLRGVFAGMHLGHTRADLYRSVLEAIAFGFRHHVDVFTDIGIRPSRVMITNGGSKSTLWKQIHADVLGIEMRPVRGHPGASLGAAVIAAIGVGALDDWSDAARFVSLDPPVVPDPDPASASTTTPTRRGATSATRWRRYPMPWHERTRCRPRSPTSERNSAAMKMTQTTQDDTPAEAAVPRRAAARTLAVLAWSSAPARAAAAPSRPRPPEPARSRRTSRARCAS